MRLSCLQENLSRGLGIVGRAVATRTTLPITQHVLFATDESRLKLSATNLELAITTWVGAQVEEEGSVTVPARLVTEFVGSLQAARIDIATGAQTGSVEMQSGRVQAHINGADANEFPPIPQVEEGASTQVTAQALRDAIHRVAFAAAVEDSRPVLTGVNVELEGERMTMAAADGFRLAVQHSTLAKPVSEAQSFIVPARTLQEVLRLLGDEEEPVGIVVSPQKSQVLFKMRNTEVVSQLIQGTFPNYSQLIPQEHGTRAVVDLREFQRAARTAAIFAKDASNIVRLQLIPGEGEIAGKLVISSRAEEVGDNTDDVEATIEGEEGKIAFNSKYLAEVLSVLGDGQAALEMTTSSSPGLIRAVGDDSYIHVVMPMFVQW